MLQRLSVCHIHSGVRCATCEVAQGLTLALALASVLCQNLFSTQVSNHICPKIDEDSSLITIKQCWFLLQYVSTYFISKNKFFCVSWSIFTILAYFKLWAFFQSSITFRLIIQQAQNFIGDLRGPKDWNITLRKKYFLDKKNTTSFFRRFKHFHFFFYFGVRKSKVTMPFCALNSWYLDGED